VNIKYRELLYKSEDVPIFVYFKTDDNRQNFINTLNEYKVGTFKPIKGVHSILAGNTIIKDKRTNIYLNIENIEEKRVLQKNLFDNNFEENNAMLCSPPDIDEAVLLEWVQRNLDKLS
jgi:hypothetical protein